VKVVRGTHKGKTGKVTQVYRKKFVIHIERLTREKSNGAVVNIGINPSNVVITSLKLDSDRKDLINRKTATQNKGTWSSHLIQFRMYVWMALTFSFDLFFFL
jgi:large subunit ribosomal protein L26e